MKQKKKKKLEYKKDIRIFFYQCIIAGHTHF